MRPSLSILLCVWKIFTLMVKQSDCSPQRIKTWRRLSALDGKNINRSVYSSSLGQSGLLSTSTKFACGRACLHRAWCRSFFYVTSSGACQVHEDIFDSSVQTTSQPGAVYFQYLEAGYCPRWKGYRVEPLSGICFKVLEEDKDTQQARKGCADEGSRLITLDTDTKLQGMLNAFKQIPTVVAREWMRIGGFRPVAEWNTIWTAADSFFQWETTGQDVNISYFASGCPRHEVGRDCIDLDVAGVFPNIFYDADCGYLTYFACEFA